MTPGTKTTKYNWPEKLHQTQNVIYRSNPGAKRKVTEWQKIFANYTFDKGLISRIQKKFKQVNSKNPNNLFVSGQMVSLCPHGVADGW